MNQTQHEFSAEIEDRIEQLFAAIDELRTRLTDGPARRELLDRVFRHTHNIKGSAAAIGLAHVSQIAHELENLLASVRSGGTLLDKPTLDRFEESAQLLLDQAMGGEPARVTVNSFADRRVKNEALTSAFSAEITSSLTEDQRWHLSAALDEGANLFIVTAGFEIQHFEEQIRSLQDRLKGQGEIISSLPTIIPEQPTRISFRIVYVSKVDLAQLRQEFDLHPDVSVALVGASERSEGSAVKIAAEPQANLIQVKLNDLDRLAASVHSLFVQTTTALEASLEGKLGDEDRRKQSASVESVRREFLSLEKEIIGLGMVPIGRTLQRAIRAGRAAAKAAAKNVDFVVAGAEILMDKQLLNAISDPLIHLVRNAVDHGIEAEEERSLLGKNKCGAVRLEVISYSGQYVVTVSDDGRGVNPAEIAGAAVALGIIAEGAIVDLEQSLRLIFRPGFSSAPEVSGVSGRGVGLDVVETAVEQVGGEVHISSAVGNGTIFEIILPATFGLLNSTVVRSEENSYCLDAGLISRCQRLSEVQIQPANESLSLKIDNEPWPILHLRSLLGQPLARSVGDDSQLLLCEFRQQTADPGKRKPQRLGLIVDALEGHEEVLVRGLGSHGGRWLGVAGATELRNGRVALVLDLPRLLRTA